VNCGSSSTLTTSIPLNSGNVQVGSNGDFIMTSIKTPNHSTHTLAKFLGTFARKLIATISSTNGR